MARKSKPQYVFRPYDVCQVRYAAGHRAGEWLDFATIRDASDAAYAVNNVDHPERAGARYGWPHGTVATFRIVRGGRGEVVYG
jgi:hypothetical protein